MSWFIEALKKYAVFSGRARRKEYWMYTLFVAIIYIVLAILAAVTKQPLIAVVFYLAILLPSLAVTVRRLHDTGRTGWWVLIGLVPLVGAIVMLVFLCSEGESGANKFGANPKEAPALV
ncbi:DUF805 domain-containing protein [Streptomyces sp. AC555_RSS877]|uniref:DUF805 domain-containing protein n=1 Tax=Streptomyces sp. AC555_RSS877 TaxID=2823688 RepID=UPI001C25CAAF|nr:DUF805 domain-containing protein [Streptomyces sp. AC555_RSS877]